MLKNKLVVLTREIQDIPDFSRQLKKLGARVYALPTIQTVKLKLSKKNVADLRKFSTFDFIIFTSAHAVGFFVAALADLKISKKSSVKIIAIGPATERAARQHGLRASLITDKYDSKGLAAALPKIEGKKILLPRSAMAPEDLVLSLRRRSAIVTVVPLYTTKPVVKSDPNFNELIQSDAVDYLTFASPSAVVGFAKRVKNDILKKAKGISAVCIGPSTAQAARKLGFKKISTAKVHTTPGIIQTLRKLN